MNACNMGYDTVQMQVICLEKSNYNLQFRNAIIMQIYCQHQKHISDKSSNLSTPSSHYTSVGSDA